MSITALYMSAQQHETANEVNHFKYVRKHRYAVRTVLYTSAASELTTIICVCVRTLTPMLGGSWHPHTLQARIFMIMFCLFI